MINNILKSLFLISFIWASIYIFFIKTEKFEASSIIMIKDLAQEQKASMLGAMLLGQSSNVMQDSKRLEIYILSFEMFEILDKENDLSQYYSSDSLDFMQRLYPQTFIPFLHLNSENILAHYQEDLSIIYDELSSTVEIRFKHASKKIAKKVIQNIIYYATKALNRLEKENTLVVLSALVKQEKENKMFFTASIRQLIEYQNQNHTIDPSIEVLAKSGILAGLEGELVKKEVDYQSKLTYLSKNFSEMKIMRDNIKHIKEGISKLKQQIVGNQGQNELNENVSNFELLKSEVDFNKERYAQSLIKLEETKVTVNQNVKNLMVILKPSVSDIYSYPEKPKETMTWLMILSFMYGIISLILSILKDHKD